MKKINKEIITKLIPLFLILILEIAFQALNYDELKSIQIMSVVFSILITYLIYGILVSITKRISTATIIYSILGILLVTANQIKIRYTGEPAYFSDANFLINMNEIITMISGNLLNISLIIKGVIIIVIFALILFFFIRWIRENEKCLEDIKTRIIVFAVCILILTVLFIPCKNTKKAFLTVFLGINDYKEYDSYTDVLSYYKRHSLLAGMYGTLLNNRFDEPKDYNDEYMNEILKENNEDKEEKKLGQPNIIVLFSESFWDVDRQNNVIFDEEVAPNIKKLKEEGKFIESLSCSYGGMSENVAFELVTGGSMEYFVKGYIPMVSLYKKNNFEKTPSILRELKKNDYETKIIFGKDYYNLEKEMLRAGFDTYKELEETDDNKKGGYISDEHIVDVIINEFENKEKSKKLFYMAETIQNHMTYHNTKYDEYYISVKESNLEEEMTETVRTYAQGVHDADKQLNRLYEYIKEYSEPTILLFLGDHLPYLHTESGKNVINYLDYFNTSDKIENLYRQYNTQTIILSNYDMDISEMPEYLSNNAILTYLVNNMNIELSDYYKWLYSTIKELPASNRYVSVDIDGNKYDTEKLEGNMKRIYDLREHMQYKLFIKPTE